MMSSLSITFLIMSEISHFWIASISRRECNVSFVFMIVAVSTFLNALETGLNLLLFALSIPAAWEHESEIYKFLTRNGFYIFLLANLLTGATNFTVHTSHACSTVDAIVILILYSFTNTIFSWILSVKSCKKMN